MPLDQGRWARKACKVREGYNVPPNQPLLTLHSSDSQSHSLRYKHLIKRSRSYDASAASVARQSNFAKQPLDTRYISLTAVSKVGCPITEAR